MGYITAFLIVFLLFFQISIYKEPYGWSIGAYIKQHSANKDLNDAIKELEHPKKETDT